MKKGVYILLICCLFSMMFHSNHLEIIQPVFSENEESYSLYDLTFSSRQLNTSQMPQYFNNVTVISISPFINSLYQDKIKDYYYSFEPISMKSNVNRFLKYHIRLLNNHQFKQDALYAEINGVYIKNIVIYANEKQVQLLQKNLNFTYNSTM